MKTLHVSGWPKFSGLTPAFAIVTLVSVLTDLGTAQDIVPDTTLGPGENSQIVPIDANNDKITGGAIRDSLLFHSFQDFSISAGRGAFFENPTDIRNILARVTGSNTSQIFGTLGVLGNANLFLLNPNGIVFGPDAQLDIDGSFTASTATGVELDGQVIFSAFNPGAVLLDINVNVPIGLRFEGPAGDITTMGQLGRVGNDNGTGSV